MPTICDREVSDAAIKKAAEIAALYRLRGYQPVPSRPDEKRPLIKFKEFWEARLPDDIFEKHPTSNVQAMTGRYWNLLVVDLDGDEAQKRWPTLGWCPKTWITHSGGDGQHWWFTLPKGYPTPLPTGFLWKGKDKHSGIERICDHGLIMAPPSIHPKNGNEYAFIKWHDPKTIGKPAACPDWLLRMPLLNAPKTPAPIRRANSSPRASWDGVTMYDANDVLDAIADKVALAETWGLRVTSRRPPNGEWVSCHAIDRDDAKPSAAIHAPTGVYTDRGSGTRLSFLALSVALGQFPSRKDAIAFLGEQYVR